MLTQLKSLAQDRLIRPLDYQFARFIHSLHDDPVLALAGALVSHQLGQGNVCLHLARLDGQSLFDLDSELSEALCQGAGLACEQWAAHLCQLPCVGDGRQATPLVLEQQRLYLYRYWQHEQQVARFLRQRPAMAIDYEAAGIILDRLFARDYAFIQQQLEQTPQASVRAQLIKWLDIENPNALDWPAIESCVQQGSLAALEKLVPVRHCLNWQKVAAALAGSQSFSVISGGPGTGKTTTVIKLLALLVELGLQQQQPPDIRLVAPTGKAAARLTESIGGALKTLNCTAQVKALIPTGAATIHRLLGALPGRHDFQHNRSNKLHLDILVVDEASMIDLPLMSQLLEALPDNSRLILLGDRDQLASVEAGSILGDICAAAGGGYTDEQVQVLERMTGFSLAEYRQPQARAINNSLCLLQKSYRFDAGSGIGSLANAVNTGNHKAMTRVLTGHFTDIRLHSADSQGYQQLIQLCCRGYQPYLSRIQDGPKPEESESAWQKRLLRRFHDFQLLCALREGRFGVSGLNEAIRNSLARAGLVDDTGIWYQGRPVLITRNDPGLGLYNGDIGITLKNSDGRLRVVFELPNGSLKQLLPNRLPEHDTVFAMTIHKSQGSEFRHTVIALPESFSPIITRELVYTGITRARQRLDLFCDSAVLTRAVSTPTARASGLRERL